MSQETKSSSAGRLVRGGIIGAVAGLPLSYFMQSEMIRAKMNIFQYTIGIFTEGQAFSQLDAYPAVFGGVVVCGIAGALIGKFAFGKR